MTPSLIALAVLVQAQQIPCGPTGPFEASITQRFGETPVGAGVTETGFPLLIFANPNTGSFTVTMRRPDKITCIIQAGKGYTVIEQDKPGENL